VSKRLKPAVFYAEQVNDWTAVLRLKVSGSANLTVINVHSPILEKQEERRWFYEELSVVYDKYKSDALVYLAGDWNARVGKRQNFETCIGSYSNLHERNEAGEDLVAFCEARDLFLCNTAFRHKWSQRATWRKPTGETKKIERFQIDYIICRRSIRGILTDSRAYPGTLYESDHSLVSARLSLGKFRGRGQEDKKRRQQGAVQARRHVRRELLVGQLDVKQAFEAQVAEKLQRLDQTASPRRRWQGALEVRYLLEGRHPINLALPYP